MSQRRMVVVQAGLLCVAMLANAAVKNNVIRIKVLDSETHSASVDDSGVPKNCDPTNYDAYCHNSQTARITNMLLVQEGDKPPFRVSCTIDAKYSRCMPLPKGESFDAKREKRGLTIYFVDENGKPRKQLYVLVGEEPNAASAPKAAVAVATQPGAPEQAAPPQAAPPARHAPTPAPVTDAVPGMVKCNFSSTPAGAEITLDGRYVGSTPSALHLAAGAHAVVIALPGFAQWKRDLTVEAGSELTVNAVLEKAQ